MSDDLPVPPAPDQSDQPDQPDQLDQPDGPGLPDVSPQLAGPLSGRRAEAARNDERILLAARAVFLADPGAPIAAVAERAGVGIAALYRRYASKEELIRRLYDDNLDLILAELEAAVADDGDPWDVFCRYVHRSLDVGGGSLSLRFPGAFPFIGEILRKGMRADEMGHQLMDRAQASGAMRPDVGDGELQWIFVSAQAIQVVDERRANELRHRYLALLLDGLRASVATPLPGPAPTGMEYEEYWRQRTAAGERR